MRRVYAARRDALTAVLTQNFPGRIDLRPAQAGVHVATRLAEGSRGKEWVEKAASAGIRIEDAAGYAALEPREEGLVFGFGKIATDHIGKAVARLADAMGKRVSGP